ncbi:MAG: carbohydrate-binding domain-containing protein [Bacteroidaceae bacterium]|nr:carbohydrate-binding domain-containing protein [Bacteroidaceae bacterium]
MKRTLLYSIAFVLTIAATGQTLNVKVGNITYQFPASLTGEMIYDRGKTVTIMGKKLWLDEIEEMTIDDTAVKDNNVSINYDGSTANITIAGNVAQYVDVETNDAHVTINQTNTALVDDDEITYALSGTSSDGSLSLGGKFKCTVSLAGVALTNPSGAVINITNKKRIQISAKKGTENTLIDGADGEQKGCIYSKGQLQLQGNGTLNVTGNTAHAIKSGDYIEVKNLTLNILSAVKDGVNCNKYFLMKSGNVTISGVGDDGIQTELEGDDDNTGETEDHEDENSGTLYTDGGTLTVNNSAAPTIEDGDVKSGKGLKALSMALNAGDITINMSGNASKAISCGEGTKTTTSSGGGWGMPGGSSTTWTDVTGTYTQGKPDGTGPKLTIKQTGSTYSSSSAKAIRAICPVTIYGGETDIYTKSSGGEGLESKTSIDIEGGQHYFKCYDDCINSAGKITFNGGITVCYSTGNDAVDSNAGTTGAITIGNGVAFAYTSKGGVEEGFDCDDNSYIQITGTGIGISAGGSQGGGGGGFGGGFRPGGGGNSSSGYTISNAQQGYAFVTSSISYSRGRYYTLADASGNNLVTYSFEASCSSNLALFTATGMVKGSSYNVKYSTSAPTDATTEWHGLYLGSTHKGTSSVTTMTAK